MFIMQLTIILRNPNVNKYKNIIRNYFVVSENRRYVTNCYIPQINRVRCKYWLSVVTNRVITYFFFLSISHTKVTL